MSRRWFGTDGIRAPAGSPPLVADFLVALGGVLGRRVVGGAGPGSPLVLIARDTRLSGPALVAALAAGLLESGAEVLDLGVLPTAGLPLALLARDARLGLVVSASHNPWRDNGIKLFGHGGFKLPDADESAIEAELLAAGFDEARLAAPRGGPPPGEVLPGRQGWPARPARLAEADGADEYIRWCVQHFAQRRLDGLVLVADCAHGAASRTAPAVFRALGAEVLPLCDHPDGRNINEGCGSTHLGALTARLAELSAAGRVVDVGLAFDGDADRVLCADRSGRIANGDHMLGFLGARLAAQGRLPQQTVVASVMSNLGLERMLAGHGVTLRRAPVGDRHVLAALREGGFALGGEASGHVLIRTGEHWIGDGLFTALELLANLRESGTGLGALIDAVPEVPQVLLNVPVAERPPLGELPRLNAAVAAAQARHGSDLRILLRYSGTEPLARVMVEGLDAAVVSALARELAALWAAEIAELAQRAGRPAAH